MARAKPANPNSENSIEPMALRAEASPATAARKSSVDNRANQLGFQAEGANVPADDRAPDTKSVPESVRNRFLQVKEKFYFSNGDPAFRDLGIKLITKSESAEIVRSLVEIAHARGWDEINVGGTKDFKRAVWHEASLRSIGVRGYTATELDEARLVQTMARRREEVHKADPGTQNERDSGAAAPHARAGRRAQVLRESGLDMEVSGDKKSPVVFGTLLAHGAENYKFNPQEDMSYYVQVRTDGGEEVYIWGADLKRALKDSKSQPEIGERIGVVRTGAEPVTVPKKERDREGRVLKEYDLRTARNEWQVESEEFLRDRTKLAEVVRDASINAKQAVGQNPALAGTYVALHGARKFAKENFSDQHEQNRFVEVVRRVLADEIRNGANLYTPELRNRISPQQQPPERTPAQPEMSPAR